MTGVARSEYFSRLELENPTLERVDANGGVVRANDDWRDGQRSDLGAIGMQAPDERESALIETLSAANYTASSPA